MSITRAPTPAYTRTRTRARTDPLLPSAYVQIVFRQDGGNSITLSQLLNLSIKQYIYKWGCFDAQTLKLTDSPRARIVVTGGEIAADWLNSDCFWDFLFGSHADKQHEGYRVVHHMKKKNQFSINHWSLFCVGILLHINSGYKLQIF